MIPQPKRTLVRSNALSTGHPLTNKPLKPTSSTKTSTKHIGALQPKSTTALPLTSFPLSTTSHPATTSSSSSKPKQRQQPPTTSTMAGFVRNIPTFQPDADSAPTIHDCPIVLPPPPSLLTQPSTESPLSDRENAHPIHIQPTVVLHHRQPLDHQSLGSSTGRGHKPQHLPSRTGTSVVGSSFALPPAKSALPASLTTSTASIRSGGGSFNSALSNSSLRPTTSTRVRLQPVNSTSRSIFANNHSTSSFGMSAQNGSQSTLTTSSTTATTFAPATAATSSHNNSSLSKQPSLQPPTAISRSHLSIQSPKHTTASSIGIGTPSPSRSSIFSCDVGTTPNSSVQPPPRRPHWNLEASIPLDDASKLHFDDNNDDDEFAYNTGPVVSTTRVPTKRGRSLDAAELTHASTPNKYHKSNHQHDGEDLQRKTDGILSRLESTMQHVMSATTRTAQHQDTSSGVTTRTGTVDNSDATSGQFPTTIQSFLEEPSFTTLLEGRQHTVTNYDTAVNSESDTLTLYQREYQVSLYLLHKISDLLERYVHHHEKQQQHLQSNGIRENASSTLDPVVPLKIVKYITTTLQLVQQNKSMVNKLLQQRVNARHHQRHSPNK